jgi:hypothetical protein
MMAKKKIEDVVKVGRVLASKRIPSGSDAEKKKTKTKKKKDN